MRSNEPGMRINNILYTWSFILAVSMIVLWAVQSTTILKINFIVFSLAFGIIEVEIIDGIIRETTKEDTEPLYIATVFFGIGSVLLPALFGVLAN